MTEADTTKSDAYRDRDSRVGLTIELTRGLREDLRDLARERRMTGAGELLLRLGRMAADANHPGRPDFLEGELAWDTDTEGGKELAVVTRASVYLNDKDPEMASLREVVRVSDIEETMSARGAGGGWEIRPVGEPDLRLGINDFKLPSWEDGIEEKEHLFTLHSRETDDLRRLGDRA